MFLQLGILLSSIFTPVCSSTPQYSLFQYPVEYRSVGENSYIPYTNQYTQYYGFSSTNLNQYLLDSIEYTQDGSYQVDIVKFTYNDGEIEFNKLLSLTCSFEVYSYYPAPNASPVLYTRNYSFSFVYLDYDYSDLPTFNFDMVAYCSYTSFYGSNNAFFDKSNRHYFEGATIDNPSPMYSRELIYYYDYEQTGQIYQFCFYVEFHWISLNLYNDALLGAYPGPNDSGASREIYENGYTAGYKSGEETGYQNGYTDGQQVGEQIGYADGYDAALNQGATASIIFNGIISVGLLPVNVFLRILNFEVFGINIGAFVSSLLTILVIIIIIRMFIGGKGSSE